MSPLENQTIFLSGDPPTVAAAKRALEETGAKFAELEFSEPLWDLFWESDEKSVAGAVKCVPASVERGVQSGERPRFWFRRRTDTPAGDESCRVSARLLELARAANMWVEYRNGKPALMAGDPADPELVLRGDDFQLLTYLEPRAPTRGVLDTELATKIAERELEKAGGFDLGALRELAKKAGYDDTEELLEDRGADYGDPVDQCSCAADLWKCWAARRYGAGTRGPADTLDVLVFNICQKLSRAANRWKDDHFVDIAGYAKLALRLPADERNEKRAPEGYRTPFPRPVMDGRPRRLSSRPARLGLECERPIPRDVGDE